MCSNVRYASLRPVYSCMPTIMCTTVRYASLISIYGCIPTIMCSTVRYASLRPVYSCFDNQFKSNQINAKSHVSTLNYFIT